MQLAWWRHQMETFSTLLALCSGNSPVIGEFPSQRPVMQNFDVSFVLRLNKRWSKQSWGRWSETPSCPLWHHCNGGPGTKFSLLPFFQFSVRTLNEIEPPTLAAYFPKTLPLGDTEYSENTWLILTLLMPRLLASTGHQQAWYWQHRFIIFLSFSWMKILELRLNFFPKSPINNIRALVQIIAWRRPADKPLSEPKVVRLPMHICITLPQWVKKWEKTWTHIHVS